MTLVYKIPLRVACCALAYILEQNRQRLNERLLNEHRPNTPPKLSVIAGRKDTVNKLGHQIPRLFGLTEIHDPQTHWIHPTAFGYLTAIAYGNGSALKALEDFLERERHPGHATVVDTPSWNVLRLLEACISK